MKIKIILLLLALCLVAPMIIPGPDGKPIMSLDDWKVDTTGVTKITNKAKTLAGSASNMFEETTNIDLSSDSSNSDNVLHKWQDGEGNWHFSDKAPEGVNARNQSVEKMPEIQNTLAELETPSTPEENSTGSAMPSLTTLPGGKVGQLINDVENVKKIAVQRNNNLEGL